MSLPSNPIQKLGQWFEIKPLQNNLYQITEPEHVTYFFIKDQNKGLFIDSGLGIHPNGLNLLMNHFEVDQFEVLGTHAHCDHSGLNYAAQKIYLNEKEWNKYQLNDEKKQIFAYFKALEKLSPWPSNVVIKEQSPWQVSQYIKEDDLIELSDWNWQVLESPGHSCGHCCFYEINRNILFLGDLLITGSNYIHLPDSNIHEYKDSLIKINQFVKELKSKPLLLACHNQIQLDIEYFEGMIQFIDLVQHKKVQPTMEWKADSLFVDGLVYSDSKYKIVIKKEELG